LGVFAAQNRRFSALLAAARCGSGTDAKFPGFRSHNHMKKPAKFLFLKIIAFLVGQA